MPPSQPYSDRTSALDAKGAAYTLTPTDRAGNSELRYSYQNAAGKSITGSKTVYDPAIHTDEKMLLAAQSAGQKAFEQHIQDPMRLRFDTTENGLSFRSYINFDPTTGAPYVGNVHPVR